MRISTKLRIGYIFSAFIVVLAGVIIFLSFKQIHIANSELRFVDNVTQSVLELYIASNEYLLHREKRPKIQWEIQYETLSRLLGERNIHNPDLQLLVSDIRDDLDLIRTYFSEIVSIHSTTIGAHEGDLHLQMQNRLQSLLLLKSQSILDSFAQIKYQIKDNLLSIQKYTNWTIVILITASALFSVIIGYLTGWSVLSPIKNLIRGMETISSGNLEIRLKTDRRDEVGQLSKSFDQMVRRLKTIMVSRDELERRVKERTAELEASHGQLVSEIEERKHAEEKIRATELRYRTVADFTYDWESWANFDGSLEYVSPSCERISGYKAKEFMEIPSLFEEIILAEDKEIWKDHHCESHKELGLRILQFRIQRKDGKIRWIEHACRPVRNNPDRRPSFRASNRDITQRKHSELELQDAYNNIKGLKERLEAESAYLQKEITVDHNFEDIIGQSQTLKYVLYRTEQVAQTDAPALILGETGTGKELIARAIHRLSDRRHRLLVKVNCATLPVNLIESELFGHEAGAFTGATKRQIGRFELAAGSTLFLDEIGEMALDLQAKLLRVLETGEFERLGNPRTQHSDARIIASTNRVLEEAVRQGRFREDLWYRLKVVPITLPPLRQRTEDIPLLIKWFVDQFSRKMGKPADIQISKNTMQALQTYPWPGNIRELRNTVESAMITSRGEKLNFELPKTDAGEKIGEFKSFEEMERDYILQVLEAKKWKIQGENSASSVLQMHPNTLRARMKKLGINKPS